MRWGFGCLISRSMIERERNRHVGCTSLMKRSSFDEGKTSSASHPIVASRKDEREQRSRGKGQCCCNGQTRPAAGKGSEERRMGRLPNRSRREEDDARVEDETTKTQKG